MYVLSICLFQYNGVATFFFSILLLTKVYLMNQFIHNSFYFEGEATTLAIIFRLILADLTSRRMEQQENAHQRPVRQKPSSLRSHYPPAVDRRGEEDSGNI